MSSSRYLHTQQNAHTYTFQTNFQLELPTITAHKERRRPI